MKPIIKAFVFDLDGTVYLGDAALPGAVEAIAELRQRGKHTLFVSNKTLEPREAYARKLTRLGIPTTPDEVITSAWVLGRHLKDSGLRFYVVGETRLREELRGYGLNVVGEREGQNPKEVIDPEGIDAVVVSFDRTLDYRKLNTAYQALRAGARFYATNADKTCPVPGGDIPDAGATIAALEHLTGREVELVAGKPSPLILQVALDRLGLAPDVCLMTGDRLETDIRMGHAAGMYTAVPLTGVTRRADADRADPKPDFIIESLWELTELTE